MKTSTFTDLDLSSGGITSEEIASHGNQTLTGHLRIPFEWKVKAGRSASLVESFYHALSGMAFAFKGERNLQLHCGFAVAAIALGVVLKIDTVGWMALTLAIGMVLTAEFLNTALEHVVDLATHKTYHPAAKIAKDTAAAGVLAASLCALATGCFLFGPHLLALLHR